MEVDLVCILNTNTGWRSSNQLRVSLQAAGAGAETSSSQSVQEAPLRRSEPSRDIIRDISEGCQLMRDIGAIIGLVGSLSPEVRVTTPEVRVCLVTLVMRHAEAP